MRFALPSVTTAIPSATVVVRTSAFIGSSSDLLRQGGQQLVQGDWEIPPAHSGRVEYRISDGGPRAAYAQLTEPFDAKHIGLVVESVEYHGIYHWNIRVDRYEVPGQIALDERAGPRIDHGLFEQCHPDSESHAANQLRTRRFGVQDTAGRKDTQHLPEPDLPCIGVHTHLGKMSAVRMDGVVTEVGVCPHRGAVSLRFEPMGMIAYKQVGEGGRVARGIGSRMRIGLRRSLQLFAKGFASAVDRDSGAARTPRAARSPALRQIGPSQFDAHLLNWQAQALSCHLGENRVGPGPNIRHIRQHDAGAVRRQPHPRFRWPLRVNTNGRGNAEPDKPSA